MSVRKTNFIKPQRIPVEPVSVQKPKAPIDNRQNKLNEIREQRDLQRAPRNNVHEQKGRVLNRAPRKTVQAPDDNRRSYTYQDIPKIWNGDTVYIVGGGASLKGFDFNQLKGKNVIAINKAYQYVNNPAVLYWTDTRFYNWYKSDIDGLSCLKITVASNNRNYKSDIRVIKNERTEKMDLSSLKEINAGNNSGFGALVLAIKMGAKKIYLLGFDMSHTSGKSHFHDGYPNLAVSREHIYKSMLKHFMNAKGQLNLAADIYNTNPKSGLGNIFPFASMREALLSP